MKRFAIYLSFVLLSSSLYAYRTDCEKDGYEGNVKWVKVTTWVIQSNKNGYTNVNSAVKIHQYDPTGRRFRTDLYTGKKMLLKQYETFSHSSDKRSMTNIVFDPKDRVLSTYVYTYDKDGNTIMEKQYMSGGEYSGMFIYRNKPDKKSSLLNTRVFYHSSKNIEKKDWTKGKLRRKSSYNSLGFVTYHKEISSRGQSVEQYYKYNGERYLKELSYHKNGVEIYRYRIENQLDETGNVIKSNWYLIKTGEEVYKARIDYDFKYY